MLKQSILLLTVLVLAVDSADLFAENASKLYAAGMSESGLDIHARMALDFENGYAAVTGNAQAEETFAADFKPKVQKYVDSMNAHDQKIFNENSILFE